MAYFNKNDIDNLNSIPIRQVAERLGIEINRAKKTKCLVHSPDNNPSMSFSDRADMNMWHCFTCGAGGGVIRLVQVKTGWSFSDSCIWLSKEFNVIVSTSIKSSHTKLELTAKPISLNTQIVECHIADTEVYNWIIDNLSIDEESIHYLTKIRKFPLRYITKLNIKSIPDPDVFFVLCRQKFGTDRLLTAGIAKVNKYGKIVPVWWDKVIIFPFYNEKSEVIYLQARRMKSDQYAKYVNLKSIPLPLYNVQILSSLEDQADVLICEGIPDCIASMIMGKNAVAIIGAHGFQEKFVDLFKFNRVTIIPDNDKNFVGEQSALKIKAMLNKKGIPVSIIPLQTYKDIAELYENYAKQFD